MTQGSDAGRQIANAKLDSRVGKQKWLRPEIGKADRKQACASHRLAADEMLFASDGFQSGKIRAWYRAVIVRLIMRGFCIAIRIPVAALKDIKLRELH